MASIKIPSGITAIGWQSFMYCFELESVELPENLVSIESQAFDNCHALKEIIYPPSLINIGFAAFINCSNLKNIEFPEGLETIGLRSFEGCNNLSTVIFPSSLTYIGEDAFAYCSEIQNIYSNMTIPCFAFDNSFSNMNYLFSTLTVPFNSKEKYQNSTGWQNFMNIEEMPEVKAEEIKLNFKSVELNIGESMYLECKVLPENTSNPTVIWDSNNQEIVSVSENGYIRAISEGSAVITASCGEASAICEVTVINPVIEVEKIILNHESAELNIGETIQLEATILPEDVSDKTVIWTTFNDNIASVSEGGLVTAISVGEATITATCGEVSAECVLTVVEDAGVESLLDNPDSKISIYYIDGVLIKKDCKVEDLKSLVKGIYIIVSGNDRYKISI